jgi:transposase InsO family protein
MIDNSFGDIPNVTGIADDLVIFGKTIEEHNAALTAVMKRCREKNVKLNPDKCIVSCTQIPFFGQLIGAQGSKPDPKKIDGIKKMNRPQDRTQLKSFLGMVNYLSKFSGNLAVLCKPIRELDKDGIPFVWLPHHETAFQAVKDEFSKEDCLQYYNENRNIFIESDASKDGLGCVLVQRPIGNPDLVLDPEKDCDKDLKDLNLKPVCYASKSMTTAESNYACIERELLGVYHALKRFHLYTFGNKVTIFTDHKPLITILNKSTNLATPTLANIKLKIDQNYDYNVFYKPGKHMNLSDALSRVGHVRDRDPQIEGVKLKICSLNLNVPAEKLPDLATETASDTELAAVKQLIMEGWPEQRHQVPELVRSYWNYRDELSVIDGVIVKNLYKVVIPASRRPQMLKFIHEGHQGITKSKLYASSSVFWDTINKDITKMTTECPVCIRNSASQKAEPMKLHDVPTREWLKLGLDVFEFDGKYFLIVVDYFSKFCFVRRIGGLSTKETVETLKQIFQDNGIPEILMTDQGTNFMSHEFNEFCVEYQVKHVCSSAHHHQSNGLAERYVQTVKNTLKKCSQDKTDHHLALLALKATPIDSTLPSPAELLQHRRFRTRLPQVRPDAERDDTIEKLKLKQDKIEKNGKELSELPIGSKVYAQHPQSKDWIPATVTDRDDDAGQGRAYIILLETGRTVSRNRVMLKERKLLTRQEEGFPELRDVVRKQPAIPATETKLPSKAPALSSPVKTTHPAGVIPIERNPTPVTASPRVTRSQTASKLPTGSYNSVDRPKSTTATGRSTQLPGKYKDFVARSVSCKGPQ